MLSTPASPGGSTLRNPPASWAPNGSACALAVAGSPSTASTISPCTRFLLNPTANIGLRRGFCAGSVQVPGGEDAGAVLRDGDGELEVGGQRAVGRIDGPVVIAEADVGAARVDHRLDGEHHARLEQGAAPRLAVVGDLRVLVHVAADAVADQRADDRQALGLDPLLDGVRDVAEV